VYAARVRRRFGLARLVLLLSPLACSKLDMTLEDPKREPFEVQVNAVSDPDTPLAGASILAGNRVVGVTADGGAAKLRIAGDEGDRIDLAIKCPVNFESPSKALTVSLRRFAPGSPVPQFEVRCPPAVRTVVVGIRAENGPSLPVVFLGRTVATTDVSGAAVFSVQVKPSEQVEVTVSTADPAAEMLRPQSPTLTFVSKDYDDFVILDVNFTKAKKQFSSAPINRPQRIPQPL
jgi:hypothetical protein